ncbi:MAG TPA: 2-oxoacid:ferredoxin oxidoreductase subunit gamma [Firmicutes bacterium]|nr:2-oxoacid:ferredoxin oxidoreductase subunit gamma [Candidatus Fermentithermobacillaceae bacterium]
MNHRIIMAGFGGQGVMLIGTLLTYSGMREGKKVSWLPSYGPEMRGGTANCAVCVSDRPIASPVVTEPSAVIAMNLPSFDKFSKILVTGGSLIINSNLVNVENIREDIKPYRIPANDEAVNLGSERVANMICLGGLLGVEGIVSIDTVIEALPEVIQERYHHLLDLNEEALRCGYEMVQEMK